MSDLPAAADRLHAVTGQVSGTGAVRLALAGDPSGAAQPVFLWRACMHVYPHGT